MKTKNKILLLVSVVLASVTIIGCASHPLLQSATSTPSPGVTNQIFAPAEWLTNAIGTAAQVNHAVPPNVATPFVDLALGGLSGILGLIAAYKTKQSAQRQQTADQHSQAADLLAATVVKAGQANAALQTASGTASLQTVAQHLDNNTL